MVTHDLGRAFWCRLRLRRGTPLLHLAPMRQARWPYLQGKTVIIRLGQNGLALGWWAPPPASATESELLLAAIGGRIVSRAEQSPSCTARGTFWKDVDDELAG
jgi:hypothetical protein